MSLEWKIIAWLIGVAAAVVVAGWLIKLLDSERFDD